jgi:hypothetical protein
VDRTDRVAGRGVVSHSPADEPEFPASTIEEAGGEFPPSGQVGRHFRRPIIVTVRGASSAEIFLGLPQKPDGDRSLCRSFWSFNV